MDYGRRSTHRVNLSRVKGLGVREWQRQQLLGLGDVGALAEVVEIVSLDCRQDLAVHVEGRLQNKGWVGGGDTTQK